MAIVDDILAKYGAAPQQPSRPRPLPQPGFLEHAGKEVLRGAVGVGSAFASLGQGLADAVGLDDLAYELGGRVEQANRYQQHLSDEIGQQQAFFQGPDSLYSKWQQGTLTPGDVGHGVSDLILNQLPQLAMGGVGMRAGRAALTPILAKHMAPKVAAYTGALAGSTGLMAAQETGSIYGEQEEKDLAKAAMMGIPAGALEAAGQMFGMAKSGVGRFVSKELAPAVPRGALDLLKDTGKVALSEALTEGSQNVFEQYGRQPGWNAPQIDPAEVAENAIGGLVLGGGIHGTIAPLDNHFLKKRQAVEQQHAADVAQGTAAATLLSDAPPLEQTARTMRDGDKIAAIEGERQAEITNAITAQQQSDPWQEEGDKLEQTIYRYIAEAEKLGYKKDDAVKRVSEWIRKGVTPSGEVIDLESIYHEFPGSTLDRETGEFHYKGDEAYPRTGTILDYLEGREQQRFSQWEEQKQQEALNGQVQGRGQEEVDMGAPEEQPALSPYHQELQEHVQHPVVQAAASMLNKLNEERGSATVAPEYLVNAAKKLYRTVQNVKEFTLGLVERFGDAIKPHALKLWNWVKNLQPGLSVESVDDQGKRVALVDVLEHPKKINIYSGDKNGHEDLSNFNTKPFITEVNGKQVEVPSIEHAFQIAKAINAGDIETARRIYQAKDAQTAKNLGRTVKGLNREKWNEAAGPEMERLLTEYYGQHEDAAAKLLSTGDAELTHISPKGINLGRWAKDFPALLMKVRNNLRNGETTKIQQPAYTNHSGGAKGADTEWDRIGRELGFTSHNHYREPKAASVDSPELRALGVKPVNMTSEEWQEGIQMADQAAKDLGRPLPSKQQYGYYAIRNWLQVKNADAVFAIGQVIKPGEKDSKGFVNKTDKIIVAGGTGYAAQMAINNGKPLYVYDQKRGFWIQNIDGKWAKTDTPILTPNYAGVGTREITDAGRQAIRDVYQKTLAQNTPQNLQPTEIAGAVAANDGQGISTPARDHKMSYLMPSSDNIWGEPTSTLKEAESGRRTATTRGFALGKVGDVITFEGKPQRYVITGVEQLTKEKAADPEWVKAWSEKEGWTPERFQKFWKEQKTVRDGAWQTSFRRIEDVENKPVAPANAEPIPTPTPEGKNVSRQNVVSETGISENSLLQQKLDLEKRLDQVKASEPEHYIDGKLNPEHTAWRQEYNRLAGIYDRMVTVPGADLMDSEADALRAGQFEKLKKGISKNSQESIEEREAKEEEAKEAQRELGDIEGGDEAIAPEEYEEQNEGMEARLLTQREYPKNREALAASELPTYGPEDSIDGIRTARATFADDGIKSPAYLRYEPGADDTNEQVAAYNGTVEREVGKLEGILKLKKYWREKLFGDKEELAMPLHRYVGEMLRDMATLHYLKGGAHDEYALNIHDVLSYLTRKHGEPYTWKEIPEELLALHDRFTKLVEQGEEPQFDGEQGSYPLTDRKKLTVELKEIHAANARVAERTNVKLDNFGNVLLDREGSPIKAEPLPIRPATAKELPPDRPRTAEDVRKANEAHYAQLQDETTRNSTVFKLIPDVFDAMKEISDPYAAHRNESQILSAETVLMRLQKNGKDSVLKGMTRDEKLKTIGEAIRAADIHDGTFEHYWTSKEARGEKGEATESLTVRNEQMNANIEPDIETGYLVAENTESKAPSVDNADPYLRPFEVDERPSSTPLFNVSEYRGGKTPDFQKFVEVRYTEVMDDGSTRIRKHKVNEVKLADLKADPDRYQDLTITGVVSRDGSILNPKSPQAKALTDRMQTINKWDYSNTQEDRISLAAQRGVITPEVHQELLDDLTAIKELTGKEKNEARAALDKKLHRIKIDLAQKAFAVDRVMDPKVFENDSKNLEKHGITIAPAELYAMFRNSGGSMLSYQNQLAQLARKEAARLSTHEVPQEIKTIVGKLVEPTKGIVTVEAERKQIEESIGKLQALNFDEPVNRYERDRAVIRLQARIAENKKQAEALRRQESKINDNIAQTAYAAALDAPVEAIFEPKETPDAHDAAVEKYFSKPDNPVRVGTFRDKMAQGFFDGLSKLFGARTVVINDNDGDFKGGYFPKTSGGPAIVINANSGLSLTRVFAHELFHHLVNKVSPEGYKAFSDALDKSVNRTYWDRAARELTERGITDYREELHSEIFAEAMHHPAFWAELAKTQEGKSLAGKMMFKLLENAAKVIDYLKQFGSGAKEFGGVRGKNGEETFAGNRVANLITDWYGDTIQQGNVYRLLANVVDEAYLSDRLNHQNVKEHILNKAGRDELKGYAKNVGDWLNDTFKSVYPKQSKGWKRVTDLVENIIKGVGDFMKKHHPKGFFEDVGRDPAVKVLAYKTMNGAEMKLAHIRATVIEKYKKVWDTLSDDQLEDIHDAMVRKKIDVSTAKGEAAARKLGLNDDQIAVFKEYKKLADDIHAQLEGYFPGLNYRPTHYGQSIRWRRNGQYLDDSFDWAMNDEFSKLEGDRRYTKAKAEDRTTKGIKADGLKYDTINPHELMMSYARDAYRLIAFREMLDEGKKVTGADGKPLIKWFDSDQKAAANGYFPVADNATRMFQYFNMESGYKIRLADGTYYKEGKNDVVFPSLQKAQDVLTGIAKRDNLDASQLAVEELHADKQHDVRGYSVIESIPKAMLEGAKYADARALADQLKEEGKRIFLEKSGPGSWSVFERTYAERDRFETSEEAEELSRKLEGEGKQVYIKPRETSGTTAAPMSRLYFTKDLSRMVNVMLAPDRFKRASLFGLTGHKLMQAKNAATAFELSMSLFHAMTIGQEMTASDAAWYQQRYGMKNAHKSFNPFRAKKDTIELVNLFKQIIESEDMAKDPELLKKANRILGTQNVDALDVVKQWYDFGGLLHQDTSLRTGFANLGDIDYKNVKSFTKSMGEIYDKTDAKYANAPVRALFNKAMFTATQPMTQWLMEQGIPRVKMAMFAKEYTLKLDRNREALAAGTITKEEIARDTMMFIEDRFGEVNWKNQWLDPTYKSALQFLFRSFTWFTGSWLALGKAGVDMTKWGWINVVKGQGLNKETRYHLTEKGRWGVNVFISHALTAGLIAAVYDIGTALTGTDDVPTPEDVPMLTRMLFPRVDPFDPQARVSIPSYVTEAFKIFMHLGGAGQGMEPTKMISGRFNSLLSNAMDVWLNEDYRGVTIRDGNPAKQAVQSALHIFNVAPIMASTIYKQSRDKGLGLKTLPTALLGLTDAPAAAKRSVATNKAFELRREEHRGGKISADEMEEKDKLKKAMYEWEQGDRSRVDEMLASGELSKRKFDIALTRLPLINRQPNPQYLDPLSQAFTGLTIESKLKVWKMMTAPEQKKHRPEIMKTYYNMMSRHDKSDAEKAKIKQLMRESKLL